MTHPVKDGRGTLPALPEKARSFLGPVAVFSAGAVGLALLLLYHVSQGAMELPYATVLDAVFAYDGSLQHKIVLHLRFPRAMAGVVAGAALGVAGVLLQTVTRNGLASPATLGVNAGAYFAVVAAIVYVPAVAAGFPTLVAFLGGVLAALLVTAIAGGLRATPLRLVLAGVAVSLTLAAATAALQMFHENETAGLFFWGSGALVQDDWSGVQYAWPRIALAGAVALVMARSLDVLALGDDVARGLGQRVTATRLGALAVGVYATAVSVGFVGPIGFVGLVAPHIVRLCGVRRHVYLLPGAALWGGVLLVGADVAARVVHGSVNELPAGVVTAIVGAPVLLLLARRGDRGHGSAKRGQMDMPSLSTRIPYPALVTGTLALLAAAMAAGILHGGITLDPNKVIAALTGNGNAFTRRVIVDLRTPRVMVAALAGAALAVSGLLFQGVVRNPLAAPDTLGVTAGAGLGALAVLIWIPGAPLELVPFAAFAGAFATLGVVYAAAWRGGVTPERLALVGLAASAFCAAWTNLIVVQADVRIAEALAWLSGSTYARGWEDVTRVAPGLAVLIPLAWLSGRVLDILGLGDAAARALGMRVEGVRASLLALGVALAASAVATVGTIGFVGLVAPHATRLLAGGRHRRLVPLAMLLGALLVVVADVTGRTLLAPKEIPAGLVTAVIGTPYFLWLLRRSRATAGRA